MLSKNEARNRDKRQRFVELAEHRTANVIRAIRVLGKLGNRSVYEYDDGDVKKIVNALNREIEALKTRLSTAGVKETVVFKL